ncbi:cyclin D2 [Ectocarpus siliculosus]|uniref:Cyclin D2 n=1 Tax=Ectocarpus siliculosus TaxID=2880 RepID=D7G4K9_ECTSI|nr:cyclin D2 [Ectocarpus siliculosus]|eukprot:CBJ48912.1 cyclin D2 [Ectocarpus siliculosus]
MDTPMMKSHGSTGTGDGPRLHPETVATVADEGTAAAAVDAAGPGRGNDNNRARFSSSGIGVSPGTAGGKKDNGGGAAGAVLTEEGGGKPPKQQRQGSGPGPSLRRLPNLDFDTLRHSLGFLRAAELARFALASTAARAVVSSHAAVMICEGYSEIRLGAREPSLSSSSRRLLPFGGPAAAGTGGGDEAGSGASSTGAAAAAAAASAAGLPSDTHNNNNNISNSDLLGQGSGGRTVRPWSVDEGSPRGGPGQGGGPAKAARYRRNDQHLALRALHHLECCGDLLIRQLKTLPRLDIFQSLQSRAVLGPTQFLTAHMRAVLVDWCVEVACQFRLSTIALHATISSLDVCLTKVAVPRCRLQLLGVVCAMIQTQAGGGCQVMNTSEAIHICDSQYNPSQVHSTFNVVVSITQEAMGRAVPATVAEILHRHLTSMGEPSGLDIPLTMDWEEHSHPRIREEHILAGLVVDLSLLDNFLFLFRPGTVAAAALFLARVTSMYYAKEGMWVTPCSVVAKKNREVLRLYGKDVCRPFVKPNKDLELRPFGAPGLGEFVASQPAEATAVRRCVERLWLVQRDFFDHLSGRQSPQHVLFRYQHMFKGIKEKFVPQGSIRLQAYQKLGLVQRGELNRMLDEHLPSTVTVATVAPALTSRPSAAARKARLDGI